MTRSMGDAIHVNVPALHAASPQIAAGYVTGGGIIQWTAADWALFAGRPVVTIDQGFTASPVMTADVRDVEAGAWGAEAASVLEGWTAARPTIYCSASVLPQLAAAGWKGDVWVANWTSTPPAAPFPVPAGMTCVAVQWTDTGGGGAFDLSVVFDPAWPAAPAVMPLGVPAAEVGQLLLNASGADMLAWQHTPQGNQGQSHPGVYATDTAGNLSLAIDGATDSFCQVWGPPQGPHGIYEARIFLPDDGSGAIADWPAWWLYGQNQADELDIIEGLGGKSAVHLWWAGGNAGLGWMTTTKAETGVSICKPGWHTGTAVITATQVQVYLDGVLFTTYAGQPLTTPLNVVHDIMGARAGQAARPATYLAAYTRVWALATPPVTPPATNWQENMMRALPLVQQGMTGRDVSTVQALCIARLGRNLGTSGPAHDGVDADFGSVTHQAVVDVQKAAGFIPAEQDGIVGPQTWPALMAV